MVKRDFTRLTPDEKINGIKATKLPDYFRTKYHGGDVRETFAQLSELTIQLGINMGLSPDDAISWARKLQEAIPRSEFDSWVATLVDGGPSIFMNTLNELKAAYPNGAAGVALVRETDPAKIYVWNGTAWEDFGDYQGLEIKDESVTIEKTDRNSLNFNNLAKRDLIGANIFNPKEQTTSTITDGYVLNKSGVLEDVSSLNRYFVSGPVAVTPNTTYTISEPVWGGASGKMAAYSSDGAVLATFNSGSQTFTTPDNAEYILLSVDKGKRPLIYFRERIMITKGQSTPTDYVPYSLTLDETFFLERYENSEIFKELFQKNILHKSANLFDGSKQTEETITDGHVINYTGDIVALNNDYFVSAPIPVKENTTYTVSEKVWGPASYKIGFYNLSGKTLGTKNEDSTSFTTVTGTEIVRFTVRKPLVSLERFKREFMLVEGLEVPDEYEPYGFKLPDYFPMGENEVQNSGPIYFSVRKGNTNVAEITYKYDKTHDMMITMKNKGPNNLFDFLQRMKVPNGTHTVSSSKSGSVVATNGTDFFGPYVMWAANNATGDMPESSNFTGGNHGYDGSGNIENNTATGRQISFDVKVDGRTISEDNFNGYANYVDIYWTNRIQATNTTILEGGGREVLEEKHHLHFDGVRFVVTNEITALEDVDIRTYYGLQASTSGLTSGKYIFKGGRGFVEKIDVGVPASSPDETTESILYDNGTDKMELGIYKNHGLSYFENNKTTTSSCFTTGGKAYFNFIRADKSDPVRMPGNHTAYFKGYYEFKPSN